MSRVSEVLARSVRDKQAAEQRVFELSLDVAEDASQAKLRDAAHVLDVRAAASTPTPSPTTQRTHLIQQRVVAAQGL